MNTRLEHALKRLAKPLAAALVAAISLLAAAHFTLADDDHHGGSGHEYEEEDADFDDVLEARRSGDVLPLGDLKATINENWPGEILKIEVKRRGGSLHYEFKVLRANGHLTEIEIDAANGAILEVENE